MPVWALNPLWILDLDIADLLVGSLKAAQDITVVTCIAILAVFGFQILVLKSQRI